MPVKKKKRRGEYMVQEEGIKKKKESLNETFLFVVVR